MLGLLYAYPNLASFFIATSNTGSEKGIPKSTSKERGIVADKEGIPKSTSKEGGIVAKDDKLSSPVDYTIEQQDLDLPPIGNMDE